MTEESISLHDLLNLSIGTPQKGAVNFNALYALLHAVLSQLGIREMKTRWTDTPPGLPDALVAVTAPEQDHSAGERGDRVLEDTLGQEVQQPDTSLQGRTASSASPTSSSDPAAGSQWTLGSRIQSCEDDVSRALKLVQELQDQNHSLRDEIMELCHQQKAEKVFALDKCCHRVDALEDAMGSLRDSFQKYPGPEELSQFVSWEVMQSALLSETESLQGTSAPASPHSDDGSGRLGSPLTAGQTSLQDAGQAATEAPSVLSGPPQQTTGGQGSAGAPLSGKASGSERYPEAVEALRNTGALRKRFSRLEARVAALEGGKVDQSQLMNLRELILNKGSQDASKNLMDQLTQQRALIESLMGDREKSVQLLNDVQTTFLQLQAECEKLKESNRCLLESSGRNESRLEELFKVTEQLQENKADKSMVERETKADKSALESKVSRLQFESVTEQLNNMFHQLLNRMSDQEQDWNKVVHKLSAEMDCKLNRMELDSMKKQLEGRWKNISEKLQAQEPAEHEDAAALRKQLVDRFHCLSCDRPVVKYSPGQHLVKLPSTPGFPAHKSIRPFTVYALEQFRQHYKSERISGLADYSHMTVSRSCGGSHTVNSAGQRRLSTKHFTHTEVDLMIQSEEVDIVGLDGHIYKGRLNAPAVRNIETKLPTISTKDGMCKTKDKSKPSKPAASPEVGHGAPLHPPHSAKSDPHSRPASSISGQDWPGSLLGCTSQSSFTQNSAAAESAAGPQADELLDL